MICNESECVVRKSAVALQNGCERIFLLADNLMFVSSSVKKEEEDLEDKKSIKKRIKELKVLDPKIAQNLCKYFPFCPVSLLWIKFTHASI